MRNSLITLLCVGALLSWSGPARAAKSYDNCTGFVTSLPAVISTPGTWCLKQDLTTAITTGDAITIASNDVTLDCNDFSIDGLSAGTGTGAAGVHSMADLKGEKVRHCTIRGFYRGLLLEGTSGGRHLVENNHLDANLSIGIRVEGDNSVVRNNLVTHTGGTTTTGHGTSYGIIANGLATISGNTVSGVSATPGTDSSVFGIYTNLNPGGSVVGNHITRLQAGAAGTAIGIYSTDTNRLVIRDNDVAGGGSSVYGVGIECEATDGSSRASNNVISGFYAGDLIDNYGCFDAGRNDFAP